MQDLIETAERETGVPAYIILSTMKVESNFRADAVSPKGAIGLMQIMPATFAWLVDDKEYDIYNAADNILIGSRYLAYLYKKYGNWDTVYAAYNAGLGNVDKWLGDKDTLDEIPFPETRAYVRKVSSAAKIYERLYFT